MPAMRLVRSSPSRRYLDAPRPLHFPVSAEWGETSTHVRQRGALCSAASAHLGRRATVGSGQFVYWDAADPKRFVTPDLYVRFGPPQVDYGCWKCWELGAPHFALEIVMKPDRGPFPSHLDTSDFPWKKKLALYQSLGVRELVRFYHAEPPPRRLRIWDRVADVLTERDPADADFARSTVLEAYLLVAEDPDGAPAVYLYADGDGRQPIGLAPAIAPSSTRRPS
jgi:hypothetical protein